MPTARERRLRELKVHIDEVHENVMRALRSMDDEAMNRAMEQQHALLQEYSALLKLKD
jgi:hypothetical protein